MENYCGKRLDGRYEIREIIGVGGMAVVYKAYDNIDDRIVAIKILKEEFLQNEEFRRRFKNEAKAIAVLSHPNIVKVYDVSFGDRLQYIVMEYIEGITLKEYIEQQGTVNWKESVHFVVQILRALQHAHDKGIVHRDIKPQNIILLQDGTIKVSDFGIARFSRGDTRTMTESAIGSVHYISPEQARGEITDDKADIYSVGVVMYEMLTGQLPFQSDSAVSVAIMQLQQEAVSPRKLNPDIPLGLEQITLRAMQKNAKDRYHSAAEMLMDLDEFRKNPAIKFDYTYFVDQEPTKYVDNGNAIPTQNHVADKTENQSTEPTDKQEAEEDTEPNKTLPILFGVLAGLLVIVAVALGIFFSRNAKKVEVPNFVGLNYAEEIEGNALYIDNFAFETEPMYVSDKEPGTVLEQNPEAKTKVKKGKVISLKIAYTDDSVLIDEVIGLNEEDARLKLEKSGFVVKAIPRYEKNAQPGIVYESYPTQNSYAEKGSVVTIYVATDQNPEANIVPSVVGCVSADMAQELIEAAGFKLGKKTEQNSDKRKGVVIAQDPAGDTSADAGTFISIVVSNGIPPEMSATITVTLPNVGTTGEMKVYLNSEEYGSPKNVLLNGGTSQIEVKGNNVSTYSVLIDGTEIQSGKIDFTKAPAVISDEQKKPNNYKMAVPNVVGDSVSVAKDKLANAGFTNVLVLSEDGKKVSSGIVSIQTPRKDDKVSLSTEIRLVVSNHPTSDEEKPTKANNASNANEP